MLNLKSLISFLQIILLGLSAAHTYVLDICAILINQFLINVATLLCLRFSNFAFLSFRE